MTSVSFSPSSGSPSSIKKELHAAQPVTAQPVATKPVTKSKPRKRVNTAEKRNQHNAIERARRETLNGKFLVLAGLLPALASHRRPSKSAIVNGSINHLSLQRNQRLLAAKLLRELCGERDQLLKEVNEWRKASGYAPKEVGSAWSDEMEEVCSVDKEVFGTFANFDGEGDGDADDDGEDDGDYNLDSRGQAGSSSARSSGIFDTQPIPAMFDQTPATTQNVLPGSNGLSWAHEFAFTNMTQDKSDMSANVNTSHGLVPPASINGSNTLPFSAFMADNMSISDSPTSASNFGTTMLTPPGTADGLRASASHFLSGQSAHAQLQTPSPRSSASGQLDEKYVMPQPQPQAQAPAPMTATSGSQWTPQQLLLLQHMQQQQALKQSFSTPASFAGTPYQGQGRNPFEMLYQQQHQQQHQSPDSFTHSILASVMPQQQQQQQRQSLPPPSPFLPGMAPGMGMTTPGGGMSEEQVQQWRKAALAGYLAQSQQGNANATGAGLRLGNVQSCGPVGWQHVQQGQMQVQNQTVEGF